MLRCWANAQEGVKALYFQADRHVNGFEPDIRAQLRPSTFLCDRKKAPGHRDGDVAVKRGLHARRYGGCSHLGAAVFEDLQVAN